MGSGVGDGVGAEVKAEMGQGHGDDNQAERRYYQHELHGAQAYQPILGHLHSDGLRCGPPTAEAIPKREGDH